MQAIDVTDLLGVPYEKNGRTLDGLDCYGLVLEVCKRFGYKLPDFEYDNTSYSSFITARNSIKPSDYGLEISDSPYKQGDLILFKVKCQFDNHCGVYLGDDQFIHCDMFGVHVQSLKDYPFEIGSVYKWLY